MSFISQFKNDLRTNLVPSQNEMDAIERIVHRHSAELRELDDEVRRLQEELDALSEERESLMTSIEGHSRLLAPFRGLPDDVFGEIFMWCLPTTYEAIVDRNEPPLVLGYVCKRWRTIAYNTPRLWATLHIAIPRIPKFRGRIDKKTKKDFTFTFERNMRQHLDGIWAWLCRSKACPLSISIHDPNSSWYSEPPTIIYYEVVCRFAARIYRMKLDVKQRIISEYLAGLPSSSFPILRILFLQFNNCLSTFYSIPEWSNAGLLNAPNLMCIKLSRFPLSLPKVRANWSNLTFIIVRGSWLKHELDVLDALKVFDCCPQLYYCDIDIEKSKSVLPGYISFSLPRLHTLSITTATTQVVELFQYADIPALREITYNSKLTPSHAQPSPLITILSRTNRKLESLTINVQFFTLSDLVECFKLVPFLNYFCHTHAKSTSGHSELMGYSLPVAHKMAAAILYILAPSPTRPVYLPNLQIVKFDLETKYDYSGKSKVYISAEEILNFIRSRMKGPFANSEVWQAAVPLTDVSFLALEGEKQIDIHAELTNYIADGLKMTLSYTGKHICSYRKTYGPSRRNPPNHYQPPQIVEAEYL